MLKRLLVIALVGLVAGVIAVAIMSALYSNSRAIHNVMSPAAYGVTSVVVFFLAFGITVLVLALTFVSRDEWADLLATGNETSGKAQSARRSKAPTRADFEPEQPDAEETKPAAAPASKLGTPTAAAANPKAVPPTPPKPAQNWTGKRRDDPQDLGSSPPPMTPMPHKAPKVEPIDAAKTDASKLMDLSIVGLSHFGLKVDDRTRLGCALFLAGAAEALAEKHKLKEGEALSVVESCADLLGGGPEFSEAFAKQYLEHLKNKDHAAIFGAGRSAILNPGEPAVTETKPEIAIDLGAFQESGASKVDPTKADAADVLAQSDAPPPPPPAPAVPSLPGLAIALDAWLGDDPAAEAQAGEAILVAEMEAPPKPEAQDTTSLNRMEVGRRVMRRALRTTGGIALKQSWGGIIASFPQASDAISAAAEMQRAASEHTALYPLEQVVLKIGVATDRAGQRDRSMPPATELAGRFLRHAKSGEIIADRLSCMSGGELGKAAKDRGTLALAGVVRPIQIATVDWRKGILTGAVGGNRVTAQPGQPAQPTAPAPAAAPVAAQTDTIRSLAGQSFHGAARPAAQPSKK